MESKWWNSPGLTARHTCNDTIGPCLACCGTVEAYQEACGVPEELRGVVPLKPRTKEDDERETAQLNAKFKIAFGG